MELIVFFVALFLSLSLLTETLGVWSRVIGAFNGAPTTGYSTHVRIATVGRFFILLSAPALGYLVDSGMDKNQISIIGFFTFLITLICIMLFFKFGIQHFGKVYRFINKESEIIEINQQLLKEFKVDKVFFSWVFVSFALTGTGVILVNYIATILPEMRAMIVQMSAVITMLGTMVHVFIIDTKLSSAADKDKELLIQYIMSFLYSRALSSAILVFMFFVLYWV